MIAILIGLLAPPGPTTWAGMQEVVGSQDVPVIGTVKTRNRSWFIAERRATADGFELVQRPCGVSFDPVMGVQVAMRPDAVPKLPAATLRFTRQPDGSFGVVNAQSGWDRTDHDADGQPGVTVQVKAAICGGTLQVASQTLTTARLKAVKDGLEGPVRVQVKQTILGASGACLKKAAADSDEAMSGWVRLVPVPAGATCQTWKPARWPTLR